MDESSIFDSIWAVVDAEVTAIEMAPVSFGVAAVIVGFFVWLIVRAHYRGQIESVKNNLGAKDSQIAVLEKEIATANSQIQGYFELLKRENGRDLAMASLLRYAPADLTATAKFLAERGDITFRYDPLDNSRLLVSMTPQEITQTANVRSLHVIGLATSAKTTDDQYRVTLTVTDTTSRTTLFLPPMKDKAD